MGPAVAPIRTLEIPSVWSDELLESLQTTVLPDYLPLCRWFGQKQRTLRSIEILETRAEQRSDEMRVMLLKLNFTEGNPVTQVLPLFIGKEDEGDPKECPQSWRNFLTGWCFGMLSTSAHAGRRCGRCLLVARPGKALMCGSTELRMILPETLAPTKTRLLEGNNPIRHSRLTMLIC